MRVCEALRPQLARAKGCIVNTASMLSFFGGGLVPAYSASKGGVAQLTKSLAIAYAEADIRVNAVAPWYIRTRRTSGPLSDPDYYEEVINRTPMRRIGEPDEVAAAVGFLCLPAASYVTGECIAVDGGFLRYGF
ncbi:hypothetical protein G6F50_015942 [Rhizopus delemar]|uniref:Uncharacterized protein n=1 Tax=Rhizopus delemar TaxID=936053 RepID=A0A9P6XVP8_9FUNG|nr:hypothetical protein G6F50_015942 [Rhizopus delemar]